MVSSRTRAPVNAPMSEHPFGELMTVTEAIDRFRGDWVLMKVTEMDDHHWPSNGYVLGHSSEEQELIEAMKRERREDESPSNSPRSPYFTFRAFPKVTSGPSFDAALRKFAADLEVGRARYDARSKRRDRVSPYGV